MSLGIAIKGAEGVVLAADCRVTIGLLQKAPPNRPVAPPLMVNYDNATKLLSLSRPHHHFGVVTYGSGIVGDRTVHSYVPEIEVLLHAKGRLPVKAYAELLSGFFMEDEPRESTALYQH